MRRKTDIEEIRKIAIAFLHLPPEPLGLGFVAHPFFNSQHIVKENSSNEKFEMVDILEHPEALEPRISYIQKQLEAAELPDIYCLMRDCYYMTFLKFTRQYMSRQDFSEYLGFSWVAAENPNQDTNVTKASLLSWFRNSDKSYLMEKEDYDHYMSLPEKVKIYRGVREYKCEKGLSWTQSKKKAEWFSQRYGAKGYVLEGEIAKEHIFAYFDGRKEQEIVCNYKMVEIKGKYAPNKSKGEIIK